MKADQMREVVDVCRMLADQTRASIVCLLSKGSESVGTLCRELKLPQPTTSHHLALLRMSGLVQRMRKGKQMFYSLNREMLTPVKQFLAKLK
jgi:DNA-binding transcriptional ArsR family regulator